MPRPLYEQGLQARELRKAAAVARAHIEEIGGLPGRGQTDGQAGADALLAALRALFQGDGDIVFRDVRLAGGAAATVVYLEGMVKKEDVEERILSPLVTAAGLPGAARKPSRDGIGFAGPGPAPPSPQDLVRQVLTAGKASAVGTLDEVVQGLLAGQTVLVVQGGRGAVLVSNQGWKGRPVEKPPIEFSLRGPREGFTETLQWSVALVRRRLQTPGLRVRKMRIGRRSRTQVAVLYLEDVAHPWIVREVETRLRRIDVDGVLDAGYIEQLIEDVWWSPFPTVNGSERPDVVVANLLEGRVAVLVDGSAFALIVPATFDSLFHSPEDNYDRWLPVSILRVVRFIGSFLALLTPSLYLAMTSFHPGLMPTKLALKVAGSREGVAFPVLIEALLAQLLLELLKEAGFRMPSPVGQIFGVVGGLVLGELGVRAGLFSEMMVIVIAVTAVASFSIPTIPLGTVIRLLGLPLMLSTAAFGLYGMVMALLAVGAHLAVLRSFGVPYLVPYAYYARADWKDTLIIYPLRHFRRRPSFLAPRDPVRLAAKPGGGPAGGAGT